MAECRVVPVGTNPVRLWGLTSRERLARMAPRVGCVIAPVNDDGPALLANLDFVFDAAWLRAVAAAPGTVLTIAGAPVLAHCLDRASREAIVTAMTSGGPLAETPGLTIVPFESATAQTSDELRKKERPFAGLLTADTARELERASYYSAYKGVTDVLTKYLWPEWAFALTRLAARLGLSPNAVTAIGAAFCVAATVLFYFGWYSTGLAAGLAFMVLDTVDGKLARCTITSSGIGEVLDHGIDLIHPPIWYWAWGVGLVAYGRPLADESLATVIAVIVACYIAQRLIEGAFIARFGMHIHVWRRFDSWFRLITARRNPNMVILLAGLVAQRPDLGLVAVAVWTVLSLVIHLVQLVQALIRSASGESVKSWLS